MGSLYQNTRPTSMQSLWKFVGRDLFQSVQLCYMSNTSPTHYSAMGLSHQSSWVPYIKTLSQLPSTISAESLSVEFCSILFHPVQRMSYMSIGCATCLSHQQNTPLNKSPAIMGSLYQTLRQHPWTTCESLSVEFWFTLYKIAYLLLYFLSYCFVILRWMKSVFRNNSAFLVSRQEKVYGGLHLWLD